MLDYLTFPSIYYFNKEKNARDEEMSEHVIKDEYISFTEKATQLLEPYKQDINKFYQNDIYSQYDYPNILLHAYSPYTYDNEHNYLDNLKEKDEQTLRDELIKSLMSIENDDFEKPKDVSMSESEALSFINDLKIDSSNKWNLLMMIQSPKGYLNDYIKLLKNVEPYFNQLYQQYEDKVEEVGETISNQLSGKTNEHFKKITYNLINYEFNGNDLCEFYVSAIFQYTLRFIENEDDVCRIVWGLESEASFKAVHEINENKLIQRVKVFKALGDQTRYGTLKLIASGISSIKEIATKMDVSSATISYHINEFLTTGIIILNKRKSKKSIYEVDYDKLNEVINDFKEDLNFPE